MLIKILSGVKASASFVMNVQLGTETWNHQTFNHVVQNINDVVQNINNVVQNINHVAQNIKVMFKGAVKNLTKVKKPYTYTLRTSLR